MKLSPNDATAIFAYGYNEAQRLDDDGIHVNDDDIHHHEESLPLHRVLHALLDTKSHSPDHSYEICVILAGMIKCGCDPHLPNVRMETALQLSAKVDGVVFSYMIRREIVSELKSTTHSAIIGEIADQVKLGFFGEEVEVSPRRGKSDKEIVNDEGKAEQDSAATTEGSGDFVSRAEFDKLKTDIKASRRKFGKILMMFSRLIELNDTSNSTSTNKLPPTEKQSSSEPNTVEITSISNKSNEEDHEDSGKAESKLEEKPSLKTDSNKRPSSAKRYTDNHEDYREFGNSEGEFQFSTESSSDGLSDDLMMSDSD